MLPVASTVVLIVWEVVVLLRNKEKIKKSRVSIKAGGGNFRVYGNVFASFCPSEGRIFFSTIYVILTMYVVCLMLLSWVSNMGYEMDEAKLQKFNYSNFDFA